MSPAAAEVKGLTDRLLAVTRCDDVDALSSLLASVITSGGRRRELFEPVLFELVTVIARALRVRVGTGRLDEPDALFTADLVDARDTPVAIDEVEPALRAVLRAVLAQLGGDGDDARFQISLVGSDPDPLARLDAVWHALLWVSVLEEPAAEDE